MAKPTLIDLFCGAGGISEGFRRAGFQSIWANDFDPDSAHTFGCNHPEVELTAGPIEDQNPHSVRLALDMLQGELDCLSGGPPCQGFSINAPVRLLDDPRNSLYQNYIAFVEEFQPKLLLFENVPGMLSLEGGRIFGQFTKRLLGAGYNVSPAVLFAAHYGVPQERWRLIVLGSRLGQPPYQPLPTHEANAHFTGGRALTLRLEDMPRRLLRRYVPVEAAIGDLPRLIPGEGSEEMQYPGPPHSEFASVMRQDSCLVKNHFAPKIAAINIERLRYIKPGGSWRDLPFELLPEGMKRARRSDHTRRYGRLRADRLAGTVMTKMDPHWGPAFHYEQDRTLTVREAARLQSFPDHYTFSGARVSQYQQVGNAVPVLMAEAIGKELMRSLAIHENSIANVEP